MSLTLRASWTRDTSHLHTSITVYVWCTELATGYRCLSIYIGVESNARAELRRGRGLLRAAVGQAPVPEAGRAHRAASQGAGRSRPAAADVPGCLPRRRRGLRLRPERRVRPDPADDQPRTQGAA